jgi:lysozyme
MELANALVKVEPPPPPVAERARGIDVSQYQGAIDWQAVKASGVEFAFIRATVGLRVDPYFAANWTGAGAAGLLRGVYHYLEHDSDGQAVHFVRTVGDREPELGYWGDLEQTELTADKCKRFLEAVDRNLVEAGRPYCCDVYTRASFFDKFGTPDWTEGRLLWVAHWVDWPEPLLPMAWSEWEFWQTTSDGAVPGIVGRVDLDVYNGDSTALHNAYGGELPEEPEETYMDIKVFDASGTERDWAWVLAEFGPLNLRLAEPVAMADGSLQKVALVEVREQFGPANINVNLDNLDGSPVAGINVAWYWPDAPLLPAIPPPTSVWENRAHYGPTNSEGVIGFALSSDAYYYWPDRNEAGPHGIWVLAPGHPSDGLFGLGMIAGTDHRHLNLRFKVVKTEDDEPVEPPVPPPVPPEDDSLARIADAAERIADALCALASWVTRP